VGSTFPQDGAPPRRPDRAAFVRDWSG